ncbi:MAG TPA: class I SAM-dependent methyltransferase [Sedimentisphaerales bacterium]|jgi:2-polyprenyl-3-methyl-5-hydroxy-6-metoxy-1,4-benzoquinol methylase|nr:class I SAM-dependent methyltransferase [Sedimentisphaerales bacterium]HNU28295.1 class I SAM-dependent methyltransferase [Sedimentisphaerales bacterium]
MKKTRKPWHEQDEFWSTFAASIFDEERKALAPVEVEQILRLLAIEPSQHVCDLCCGVGRHAVELAKRGFAVTAVDRTRRYLHAARSHARDAGVKIEFVHEDMRQFSRLGAFDAVLNLFTSFGYFKTPGEDRQVIENIHRSLKPGGKLLIDVIGKEILARIFRARDWRPVGNAMMLEERRVINDWGGIESRWVMVKDGRQQEWLFSHRIYAATELRGLVESCGFQDVAVYGSLSGTPYDEKAERLVVAGRTRP